MNTIKRQSVDSYTLLCFNSGYIRKKIGREGGKERGGRQKRREGGRKEGRKEERRREEGRKEGEGREEGREGGRRIPGGREGEIWQERKRLMCFLVLHIEIFENLLFSLQIVQNHLFNIFSQRVSLLMT